MKIYLREIRKAKQVSIRKLAKLSGVSKSHIGNIELLHYIPTICTLYKLAKALGVKMEDLFSCEDKPIDNENNGGIIEKEQMFH